jgi:hypothetical protein
MGSNGHQLPTGFSRRLLTDNHERRYLESCCTECGAIIFAAALSLLHEGEWQHVARCHLSEAKPEPARAAAKAVAAA